MSQTLYVHINAEFEVFLIVERNGPTLSENAIQMFGKIMNLYEILLQNIQHTTKMFAIRTLIDVSGAYNPEAKIVQIVDYPR